MSTTFGNGDHAGPQPYTDLWFSDGSIVLKTEALLFRVHKSILARESTVFNDMFAFPTDGSTSKADEYEGLAVVPLIGDDETAVICLLKMIYEPNYRKIDETILEKPYSVDLYKLSAKYHFSGVEEAIASQIKVAFPSTREAFISEQSISMRKAMFSHGNILRLLPVLQEAGIANSLPSLFYCCSQYSIPTILAEGLPPGATELLLVGREKVKYNIFEAFAKKIDQYHPGTRIRNCMASPTCPVMRSFTVFNMLCQFQTETTIGSGGCEFFTMPKTFDEILSALDISTCDACKTELKQILGTICDEVWTLLSESFGLTS